MTNVMSPEAPVHDLRRRMDQLRFDLRDAIEGCEDPQAKALLEVSAEVMGGLIKAFDDYQEKMEPAWRMLVRRIFP